MRSHGAKDIVPNVNPKNQTLKATQRMAAMPILLQSTTTLMSITSAERARSDAIMTGASIFLPAFTRAPAEGVPSPSSFPASNAQATTPENAIALSTAHMSHAFPIISGLLAAAHYLLIRTAKRTRSLVQEFRLYARFLAGNKSVNALCAAVGQSRETVLRNLMTMCRRGYIKGHIDPEADEVVLEGQIDRETDQAVPGAAAVPVRCPGCGAMNRAGDKCRYCGKMSTIYLAGGCFWGMQKFFDQFEGVFSTQVGYANGPDRAPTYEEVCRDSGHAETVRVDYDETRMSLERLLDFYFMVIDPLSVNRQGHDEGIQYRTGVFYTEDYQRPVIEKVFAREEQKAGRSLAVLLEPLRNFFPAEEYHQKYLEKNPGGYCHIPQKFYGLEKKSGS